MQTPSTFTVLDSRHSRTLVRLLPVTEIQNAKCDTMYAN